MGFGEVGEGGEVGERGRGECRGNEEDGSTKALRCKSDGEERR